MPLITQQNVPRYERSPCFGTEIRPFAYASRLINKEESREDERGREISARRRRPF